MSETGYRESCASCVHFRDDARFLEAAFTGLTSLSSAAGSTRGDDGICTLHDRYLGARSFCPQYSPAPAMAGE